MTVKLLEVYGNLGHAIVSPKHNAATKHAVNLRVTPEWRDAEIMLTEIVNSVSEFLRNCHIQGDVDDKLRMIKEERNYLLIN